MNLFKLELALKREYKTFRRNEISFVFDTMEYICHPDYYGLSIRGRVDTGMHPEKKGVFSEPFMKIIYRYNGIKTSELEYNIQQKRYHMI